MFYSFHFFNELDQITISHIFSWNAKLNANSHLQLKIIHYVLCSRLGYIWVILIHSHALIKGKEEVRNNPKPISISCNRAPTFGCIGICSFFFVKKNSIHKTEMQHLLKFSMFFGPYMWLQLKKYLWFHIQQCKNYRIVLPHFEATVRPLTSCRAQDNCFVTARFGLFSWHKMAAENDCNEDFISTSIWQQTVSNIYLFCLINSKYYPLSCKTWQGTRYN